MASYRQINYLKTLLSQASRKSKQDFEDTGILLNALTPQKDLHYWINRLEKEVGVKERA